MGARGQWSSSTPVQKPSADEGLPTSASGYMSPCSRLLHTKKRLPTKLDLPGFMFFIWARLGADCGLECLIDLTNFRSQILTELTIGHR